jgi:hypothetical protein
MVDRYIIYRKSSFFSADDPLDPTAHVWAYFVKYTGITVCWTMTLADAASFDSYDEAMKHIPVTHLKTCGVDLHPESRYEQP